MSDMPEINDTYADALSLMRLQEIDLALLKMKDQLKNLPAFPKIKAENAAKKRIASEKLKLTGKRKDLEIEASDLEKSRKKTEDEVEQQSKMLRENSSDHRIIADVERSLSNLAKAQDKIDFQYEKVLADLQTIEFAEAKLLEQEQVLDKDLVELNASLENTTSTMQAEAKRLNAERARCVADIDEDLYKRYQKGSQVFRGLGVEVLKGNKPSICRVELQPSGLAEIEHDKSCVQECPYCRRILITKDIGACGQAGAQAGA